jgi:hypothetical protein
VEVGRATKDLEMSEVGGETMEHGVGNTATTAGGSGRGEAVTEVNSRAHGESPIFSGALGMLKHSGGGVREGSPMAFQFGEPVVGVRGRKLGSVTQRRDHGAASNMKVVRTTVELDGGPESRSKEHARVQVPYVSEDGGHSGSNCFLRWECKEPTIVGKVINYTMCLVLMHKVAICYPST